MFVSLVALSYIFLFYILSFSFFSLGNSTACNNQIINWPIFGNNRDALIQLRLDISSSNQLKDISSNCPCVNLSNSFNFSLPPDLARSIK